MKKIISVMLALIMLWSCFSIAVSADCEVPNTKYPTIQINGNGAPIFDAEDNKLYDGGYDSGDTIMEAMPKLLSQLAYAEVTGDYKPYCDTLYNALASVYSPTKLDNNGNPTNGTHGERLQAVTLNGPQSSYRSVGFNYDWRLDPYETADMLHGYISEIKARTGAEKVNLEARCIGGMVPLAYIEKYGTDDVAGIALISAASNGARMFEGFLSGRIILTPDSIKKFAQCYINYDYSREAFGADMSVALDLVEALVPFIEKAKILGFTTDFIMHVLNKVKNDVLPRILLEAYATFPGYWSMIGDEYYDDAMHFIFGDENDPKREEYAGLIEKITYYHETAFAHQQENLKKFVAEGGKLCILDKYNINIYPFCDTNSVMADGMFTTEAMGYGPTCASVNGYLPKNYKSPVDATCAIHNHISVDNKVDASTCAFPEYTWFVRDNYHDAYADEGRDLAHLCFDYDGQMTVWDNEKYPQFMQFWFNADNGEYGMVPLTKDSKTLNQAESKSQMTIAQQAIELLVKFFRLIKHFLFRAE